MSTTAEKPTQVTVSTTVTINGTTKTFSATSETDTPGYSLAQRSVNALADEANGWIHREERGTAR